MILAGKTGGMHGYFIIPGVVGPENTNPHCNAANNTDTPCTTETFIDTHFAPCYLVTCTVSPAFEIPYSSRPASAASTSPAAESR